MGNFFRHGCDNFATFDEKMKMTALSTYPLYFLSKAVASSLNRESRIPVMSQTLPFKQPGAPSGTTFIPALGGLSESRDQNNSRNDPYTL